MLEEGIEIQKNVGIMDLRHA